MRLLACERVLVDFETDKGDRCRIYRYVAGIRLRMFEQAHEVTIASSKQLLFELLCGAGANHG